MTVEEFKDIAVRTVIIIIVCSIGITCVRWAILNNIKMTKEIEFYEQAAKYMESKKYDVSKG